MMTLIQDCQTHLDKSLFEGNNLVVSYKLGAPAQESTSKKEEITEEEQMSNNIVEF